MTSRRRDRSTRAVRWTDRARRDLQQIGDYIAASNPSAARQWVAGLLEFAGCAAEQPLAGRRVPEVGRDDLREVFRRTYRLVYRVRDDAVEGLTVFEGHRLLPPDAINGDPGAQEP